MDEPNFRYIVISRGPEEYLEIEGVYSSYTEAFTCYHSFVVDPYFSEYTFSIENISTDSPEYKAWIQFLRNRNSKQDKR